MDRKRREVEGHEATIIEVEEATSQLDRKRREVEGCWRWTSDAEALPPRPPQPEIGDEPSSCTCVKLKGARLEFEAGGFRCYAKEVLIDEYPDLEVSQFGLQHGSIHVVTLGACPEHLVHPAEELMMAQKRVDIAYMMFDRPEYKRLTTRGHLVSMDLISTHLSMNGLALGFACTEGFLWERRWLQ